MESFTWTARVSSRDEETSSVVVRQHRYQVGSPVRFDQEYPGVTSLEQVLGALGADVVSSLRIVARRRRVEIDNVEATVEGELNNPLVHLAVVGEEGHPGLERVRIKVYVSTLATREDLGGVWEEALRRSPLVCTFRNALDLQMDFKIVL
jgi:hypothetical protein